MPTDDNALDAIRLLSLKQVAAAVGRSPDTINSWCREGFFPKPLQARPGAPKQWRMKTVADWIERRARARYIAPARRGKLKQYRGGK